MNPKWGNAEELNAKLAKVREREGLAKDHCGEMYGRPSHQERMKRVVEILEGHVSGCSFLDIGCAEGVYCGLAKRCGASRVVGMDVSPTKISMAQRRYPDCEFLVADIMRLGPWNRAFEVILCSEVFQHVPDYVEAARGVFACLQLGGLAIITVPNLSSVASHVSADITGKMTVEQLLQEIGGAGFGKQNALWKFNSEQLYKELAELPGMCLEQTVYVDTPDGQRQNLWTIGLFRMSSRESV